MCVWFFGEFIGVCWFFFLGVYWFEVGSCFIKVLFLMGLFFLFVCVRFDLFWIVCIFSYIGCVIE